MDLDIILFKRGEAGMGCGQRVNADWNRGEKIRSVGARVCGETLWNAGPGQDEIGGRYRGSRRIRDGTQNLAEAFLSVGVRRERGHP